MKITYCNNKLEKSFKDLERLKKKINIIWLRRIKRYLDNLSQAETFQHFLNYGIDHPEALVNYSIPTWSLRIDSNVRLIFELEKNDFKNCRTIIIKGVCDYHDNKYNWFIS